jgi:hypothetical protein
VRERAPLVYEIRPRVLKVLVPPAAATQAKDNAFRDRAAG